MSITQKFAEHFETVSQAHDAEDWDKVAELQAVERELLDSATPEEQYEYYLRVAKDHTGVELEKIDRAIAIMCLSDDVEVKIGHITQHVLSAVQKLITKSERADENLDQLLKGLKSIFDQDIKPLPKGYIAPLTFKKQ